MTQILLVEDDRDIRESLKDALEDRGHEVTEAFDGLDALERLRGAAALPELILLDLMMPRMNGVELREHMLTEEAWRAIPVIVLTADTQARAKAAAMGVAGYLTKPLRLADLFAEIRRVAPAAAPA